MRHLLFSILAVCMTGIMIPSAFAADPYVSGSIVTNGIMSIPPTEQGAGSDDAIPSWIKNNAGWWADGQIDDNSFVSGLQWLISNGIMKVS